MALHIKNNHLVIDLLIKNYLSEYFLLCKIPVINLLHTISELKINRKPDEYNTPDNDKNNPDNDDSY